MLGATLARAALTYDAVKAYERAIELQPRHPGAMLGLGHVLKTVGRQDEAIAAYRKCTELKPDNGESYWSLANLKTYRFSDDEIKGMQDRLANGELDSQSEVNFLFALAKSFDDNGDYESAWQYYDQGNKQQRMLESYDPVENEIIADTMIGIFDEAFLQANKGLGCPDYSPIFIVGLPRSGSTLIEQIISSHSTAEGTAELPYIGRVSVSLNLNRADGINYPLASKELKAENFRSLGEDYLEMTELHRTEGSAHFIDKMPNNFPHLGFMHLILPNAKIIDARRNPLDACVGGYRQLFARGQPFTYDLTDIGEYWMQYERLMDHWHSVMPGKVLTVQYEDVVTDFDNQVRRILEFCELPFEESCLRFHETERPIRTASSEQVRQPVYQSSVNHWRKYDEHLGELKEVLEPVRERYCQYDEINR